jgi:hypothetical protein
VVVRQDIDEVLKDWPYKPGTISVRRVAADDGREVLQMRIDMGLLQLESSGRPDGRRPHDATSYLDFLVQHLGRVGDFRLSEAQCLEMDREFLQYYHRRICWLALREFHRAVADADHTLALMDYAAAHSPDDQWTQSHEQYRPFVLFHRTQAAALSALEQDGPDVAIEALNSGLDQIRALRSNAQIEGQPEGDEQLDQLEQLKEWLRKEYHIDRTLQEQLSEAVAQEQYERAAQLRDAIARREKKPL